MKPAISPGLKAAAALFLTLLVTGLVETWNGRSLLGPDGRFGLWTADIWSAECSQRVADAYSFSHIAHGILFYALFWFVARWRPVGHRFTAALVLEAAWELLENSPVIINRYREATMALGYAGDSIVNSLSDIVMMSLGFLLAAKVPWWVSALVLITMEIGCALWIRDNLTLNVIMLIHPVEAIKQWQMGTTPG